MTRYNIKTAAMLVTLFIMGGGIMELMTIPLGK